MSHEELCNQGIFRFEARAELQEDQQEVKQIPTPPDAQSKDSPDAPSKAVQPICSRPLSDGFNRFIVGAKRV